jgi:hypothetical protein
VTSTVYTNPLGNQMSTQLGSKLDLHSPEPYTASAEYFAHSSVCNTVNNSAVDMSASTVATNISITCNLQPYTSHNYWQPLHGRWRTDKSHGLLNTHVFNAETELACTYNDSLRHRDKTRSNSYHLFFLYTNFHLSLHLYPPSLSPSFIIFT